jgi:hypothetical protein
MLDAIIKNLEGMSDELAARVDKLQEDGHLDCHASAALYGIIEGLASIQAALQKQADINRLIREYQLSEEK